MTDTEFVQGLTWFLFVIVLGALLAVLVLAVAAIVKTCRRHAPDAPPPQVQLDPVVWTLAVEVTNPDETKIMAVRDPMA